MARLCGDRDFDRRDRQRRTKGRCGRRGRHNGNRDIEAEPSGAAAEKTGIADDIERRQFKLGAPPPYREREIRTDPGRFAERQCQRLHDLAFIA